MHPAFPGYTTQHGLHAKYLQSVTKVAGLERFENVYKNKYKTSRLQCKLPTAIIENI